MGPRAYHQAERLSEPVRVLQTELRDLVELALQVQHVKWSLVPDAPVTSAQLLADVVADAWHRADLVADELRSRGSAPDARIPTIASNPALYPTPGGWLDAPMVVGVGHVLGRFATWAHERAEELPDEPEVAHLLTAISRGLDEWSAAVLASARA
jgi:DNA-binding ferritin-like protein